MWLMNCFKMLFMPSYEWFTSLKNTKTTRMIKFQFILIYLIVYRNSY